MTPTEFKEKLISASKMEAGQLLKTYVDSLKYEENQLSEVYELEILRRLYRHEYDPTLEETL